MDEEFLTGRQMLERLEEALAKARGGEVTAFAARVQRRDGTWEDIAIGFKSQEDLDAALAALRRRLGQLH
jgi:hypothetical protein